MTRPCLCPDLAGQALELGRPRDKRGQVEAEGLFDRTPLPFPSVALAVGAVAADYQTGRNQLRQGSSQRGQSRSVRAHAQFAVRREDNDVLARRQRRIWMKRQQSAQDRERPVREAEAVFGFSQVAENPPFMGGRIFGAGFCSRLRCHHGERERPPPKGRRWNRPHSTLLRAKESRSPTKRRFT